MNRGFMKNRLYSNKADCTRFIETLNFLTYDIPIPFSQFVLLKDKSKYARAKNTSVSVCTYCLMPNHFHIVLKQHQSAGIEHFMQRLQTSYTKYLYTKYKKRGKIFDSRFKAFLISSSEQLFHTSRYIHLNPYSSKLLKSKSAIFTYPYSSISEYLMPARNSICDKREINNVLAGMSVSEYKKSLLARSNFQRSLEFVKKL